MFKHKKFVVLAASALVLAACGGTSTPTSENPSGSTPTTSQPGTSTPTTSTTVERIRLQVWGPQKEGEKEIYEHLAAEFQKLYPQIQFIMDFGDVGEADAATNALLDADTAADVFMFADDQLSALVSKGVLAPLSDYYAEMVQERDLASAVDAATFMDPVSETEKVFAFPVAADNGYFLMYNNDYFTETDVLTLEAMLAKATADHQIAIDMGNGYYAMSPVMNIGELTYDAVAKQHVTNYDEQLIVDAMQGFAELVQPKLDKGFKSINIDDILADFGDAAGNKIVAVVNGMWNADNIIEQIGDRFAATKLPTFTSADDSVVQMGSFAGSKLVGVKANAKNQAWAFAFAEFITNEAAQAYRYAEIGKGPSNANVSAGEEVQANEALAALGMQAEFAIPQGKSVGSTFWNAAGAVGNFVVNGPTTGDGPQTVEEQLDAFVAAITAAAV